MVHLFAGARRGFYVEREASSFGVAARFGMAAMAGVPAHGFLVNNMTGEVRREAPKPSPRIAGFLGWMKQILMACFWAALIAAGQLVYTHFTKKWENSGFPTLPIQAMRSGNGAPSTSGSGVVFTSGPGGPATTTSTASAPRQTSFLDEYRD
jgi:hypothetical protein